MTRAIAIFCAILCSTPALPGAPAALAAPMPSPPPASSAEPEDVVDRGIDGGTSCSYYLEHRRTNPNLDKIALAWGLGMMSGLNTARLLSGLDSRSADNSAATHAAITAAMIQYCELHPEDAYSFGITWQVYRNRPLIPGSQEAWQRRRGG
jgi:hypothetical protein